MSSLLFVAVTLVTSTAQPAIPLNIMTFNLRCASSDDGENSWPNRRETVIDTIHRYTPTIFGTQECEDSQAQYLAKSLPEYGWFGKCREKDGTGEMMTVFYLKSDWDVVKSGHFWLSEHPEEQGSISWDSRCTRMATWLHFKHKSDGQELFYINTHLDHVGEQARQEGARLILDRINTLGANLPIILTGDFNCNAESAEAWKIFVKGGLRDAWQEAAKHIGPTQTFGNFKAPDEKQNGERIDWIMIRGPFAVNEAETILFNKNGHYPTDHYPVTAKIQLN